MARRDVPEINAGSMADIAFLLLIFFLVTTTMNVDSGINKKLSEKPPPDYEPPVIKQKNIFEVNINRNNELLVEGERMELKDLKEAAIKFIDNGGGVGKPGKTEPLVNHVTTAKENKVNLLQIILIKRLSPFKVTEARNMARILLFKMSC